MTNRMSQPGKGTVYRHVMAVLFGAALVMLLAVPGVSTAKPAQESQQQVSAPDSETQQQIDEVDRYLKGMKRAHEVFGIELDILETLPERIKNEKKYEEQVLLKMLNLHEGIKKQAGVVHEGSQTKKTVNGTSKKLDAIDRKLQALQDDLLKKSEQRKQFKEDLKLFVKAVTSPTRLRVYLSIEKFLAPDNLDRLLVKQRAIIVALKDELKAGAGK